MRKRTFWDILAWVCLFILAIWIILKMLGIINSLLWVEHGPVLGAIYMAGWAMSKLERVEKDVFELKRDMRTFDRELNNIKLNCSKC
ncbi:hypothetical protein ACFLZX_05345 [Nanoarchaeota archaeon]